ncbi:MarR family transcriptional regulator [Starkeya koreensis]|uniref:MarR family transcriptional regulator n=1 Tax=Ancylobacter koreensis TaxID=266121 RepID=A0ABT0DNB6_9HYPH|nr:MarR family transcriptional regulator [Ancylobacter koreensis]MCK0208768.1 MarR family transcriptional regulator [Ancylobacter koreensis]
MTRPPPVPALQDHLGFWLRLVSNHVSHAFAARLAEREVTVAEWVTLRTLHARPPLSPSRLAAEISMTRGAITKLADRLIAKGLVRREADPEDGRAQTLALTPAGAALVPALAALADANDTAFFAPLDARERATMEKLLRRLVDAHGLAALPVD